MTLLRFTRGVGLAGAIVRFATWSQFSHVGFRLDDGRVLDACPGIGVSIHEQIDEESDHAEYFSIEAPKVIIAGAVEWAKTQVGKSYDWTAIYGMAFRRDWHDDRAWFCSELVTAAFDQQHWPLIRDSDQYDRITPRDTHMSTRIRKCDPQPKFSGR
jgi:uncharacterized protein YycO